MTNDIQFSIPEKLQPRQGVYGAWATIGFGLLIGLLFIGAQTLVLAAFIISYVILNPGADLMQEVGNLAANGTVVSVSTIVSAIVGLGLIVLLIKLRRTLSLGEYLGFRRISWKTAGLLILLTAGLVLVIGLIGTASPDTQDSAFMVDIFTTGSPVLLWFAVVAFAPAFEETFFRGFLFVGLQNSRIGVIGTILFTSLVWAALHIQYDVYGMLMVLALGIVMGIVRWKTNSLWGSMLMHSLWNLVALLGTMFSIGAMR